LPSKERLREQGLFRLEKRLLQGDLTASPSTYNEGIEKMELGSSVAYGRRRRGKGHQSYQEGAQLTKELLSHHVTDKRWNGLPTEVAQALSLAVFKTQLDKALINLV